MSIILIYVQRFGWYEFSKGPLHYLGCYLKNTKIYCVTILCDYLLLGLLDFCIVFLTEKLHQI
jgi:hypothetical protein